MSQCMISNSPTRSPHSSSTDEYEKHSLRTKSPRKSLGINWKGCGLIAVAVTIAFIVLVYFIAKIESQNNTVRIQNPNESVSPLSRPHAADNSDDLVKNMGLLSPKDRRAVSIYAQAVENLKGKMQVQYTAEAVIALSNSVRDQVQNRASEPLNRVLAYQLTLWSLRMGYNDDPGIVQAKQMLESLDIQ